MNAKGNLSPEQYSALQKRVANEDVSTIKQAKWEDWAALGKAIVSGGVEAGEKAIKWTPKMAISAIGLLLAGAGVAGGIGTYAYTKANDPGNIKYNAMRKGLQEYAKSKANESPITLLAPDNSYFEALDKGTAHQPIRKQPEIINEDLNRPLKMTF